MILFVYKKDQEIIVRDAECAVSYDSREDWRHIATIEAEIYIQNLLREFPVLARRMEGR